MYTLTRDWHFVIFSVLCCVEHLETLEDQMKMNKIDVFVFVTSLLVVVGSLAIYVVTNYEVADIGSEEMSAFDRHQERVDDLAMDEDAAFDLWEVSMRVQECIDMDLLYDPLDSRRTSYIEGLILGLEQYLSTFGERKEEGRNLILEMMTAGSEYPTRLPVYFSMATEVRMHILRLDMFAANARLVILLYSLACVGKEEQI